MILALVENSFKPVPRDTCTIFDPSVPIKVTPVIVVVFAVNPIILLARSAPDIR